MNRPELQVEELRLIDLIVDEGMGDGLQSMVEHPQCGELQKLQDELYKEERMKLNKKDMLKLAERLDSSDPHKVSVARAMISDDLLTSMAYQLGYFFEAMEEIEMKSLGSKKGRDGETLLVVRNTGMYMALDILTNALVYKEDK